MSKIAWTDETWNPIAGCSIVSPGCANCYAMNMAARLYAMGVEHYRGLSKRVNGNSVWTGNIAIAPDEKFLEPLRWKKPRRVFVNSMSDLFHDGVAEATIDRVFAVMALEPQHTFQILTKRPKRMRAYIEAKRKNAPKWVEFPSLGARVLLPYEGGVPTNIWLGVTAEDQERADERIPELLATPAAKRFISGEPLLGPLDIDSYLYRLAEKHGDGVDSPGLDWVIVGGESGPSARPMHPQWARDLRDQCKAAGVAYFFKQFGEWAPAFGDDRRARVAVSLHDGSYFHVAAGERPRQFDLLDRSLMVRLGKKAAGDRLDGIEHKEFPA